MRLTVAPETNVEERPGREVAFGQRAHRRSAGHVFVLRLVDDLIIRCELGQTGKPLGKDRGCILDGGVNIVQRVDGIALGIPNRSSAAQGGEGSLNRGDHLPDLIAPRRVLAQPFEELLAGSTH